MMLRDRELVICVGAAKAGTTSLHALMSRHPEVCTTIVKETDFFYYEDLYTKGTEYYLREYFPSNCTGKVLFEADPAYMYGLDCIKRIYIAAPHAKIIVMLRNPVDRAFSQYAYRMGYQRYDESFEQMCRNEHMRIVGSDLERMEYGCLDRSRYAEQIERILALFPREQVYFILFERFIKNQQVEFEAVQRWLGLTPVNVGSARENVGGKPRSLLLAKLLYHPRYRALRLRMGRLVFGKALRRSIYRLVSRANHASHDMQDEPKLDLALRRKLLEDFSLEIERTQRLTGLDLSLWTQN